jgi:hypothetical protein
VCHTFSYTWAVLQTEIIANGLHLSSERHPNATDKRLLEILRQGLAEEFPNPERIGCPGSALLKGIAQGWVSLAEAEPWLDHLGACSPCFQEFTEFRRQAASQRRRIQAWVAVAAVLVFAVAGWLSVRNRPSVAATDTAVLDLRERSVARGQNPSETGHAPLEISRSAKHLILDLPIGSKEGPYEIGLFTETGDQILRGTGTAQLHRGVTSLRVDLNVRGVSPGAYFLGVRQSDFQWARYPLRVL